MTLFVDAVTVTLGIFTAVLITTLAGRVAARLAFEVRQYHRRQARLARARAYEARTAQVRIKANQMLDENVELNELVEALRCHPYVDGDNAANYQRAKLQKQLRAMVPNKALRDVFYAI